jgi:tight adherence protein B
MTTIIVTIVVFIGVTALIMAVMSIFRGPEATAAETKLEAFANAIQRKPGKGDDVSFTRGEMNETITSIEEIISRYFNLRKFLEQADTTVSVPKFLLMSLGGGFALGSACFVSSFTMYLSPIAFALGAVIPYVFFYFKRGRRLAQFGKSLPEALELMGRALRSGHSLGAGLHLCSTEMKGPLAKEFYRCYEQQNLGIPLEQSLRELTERVPNVDLRFFATAVILQRQTGGDLAEILDKIGYLIRERFKIWGQVQALTGEGRLSGIVLLALPPVLFIVMYRLNPEYVMTLFTDELGRKMLAGAIVMQLLGALVIKKIITIKV